MDNIITKNDQWKTPEFRNRCVQQISSILSKYGNAQVSAVDVEQRIFSRSNSMEDYFNYIKVVLAKLPHRGQMGADQGQQGQPQISLGQPVQMPFGGESQQQQSQQTVPSQQGTMGMIPQPAPGTFVGINQFSQQQTLQQNLQQQGMVAQFPGQQQHHAQSGGDRSKSL